GDVGSISSLGNQSDTFIPSLNHPEGTYTYVLTGVTSGGSVSCYSSLSDTFKIKIIGLPKAEIKGFEPVCQGNPNPRVNFIGSGGMPPYIFSYEVNGNKDSAATTNNDYDVS